MQETDSFTTFPLWIVILSNAITIPLYAIGAPILAAFGALPAGTRFQLLAPLARNRKGPSRTPSTGPAPTASSGSASTVTSATSMRRSSSTSRGSTTSSWSWTGSSLPATARSAALASGPRPLPRVR